MRQIMFRALITLEGARHGRPARQYQNGAPGNHQYQNHTHALMIRASCLQLRAYRRYFPAEISWDDEQPLQPGKRTIVTITLTDDEAAQFFDAGQRFAIWNGGDVGHGIISRRVFTTSSPCLPPGALARRVSRAITPVWGHE
jgi:hypothetical protein